MKELLIIIGIWGIIVTVQIYSYIGSIHFVA